MLKKDISPILRCPSCSEPLLKTVAETLGREQLECSCGHHYPIVRGIPRFVDSEKYVASFGIEWNRFPQTQLDSANGTRISSHRFKQITGVEPSTLSGKRVLEIGCGMGRFLEIVAEAGAEVWGLDLSLAVEAAAKNMERFSNCQIIQADLFNLPFGEDFDFIYSFGVLHHTPNPQAAFLAITRHLRPGGQLAVWVYGRGVSSGIKTSLIPRPYQIYGPIVRVLPASIKEKALAFYTRSALVAGSIPLLGGVLKYILPIQDLRRRAPYQDGYEPGGNTDKREQLRFEWALHSAFDMFTPSYTRQQDNHEVLCWAKEAGLIQIEEGAIPATVLAIRPTNANKV